LSYFEIGNSSAMKRNLTSCFSFVVLSNSLRFCLEIRGPFDKSRWRGWGGLMLCAMKGDSCDLITASRSVVLDRLLFNFKLLGLGKEREWGSFLQLLEVEAEVRVCGLMTTTRKGLSKFFGCSCLKVKN
jgi:hypothetical protein